MNQATILRPVITENAMKCISNGWYTFAVSRFVRKENAKKVIEDIYKVNVIDIRSIVMKGKTRRAGRKQVTIKQSDWKKIMVKIKKGQTIEAFDSSDQTKHSG